MLKLALLVGVVGAVGCHRDAGPAWPKSAGAVVVDDWREDGGESLEPRVGHAAGVESSAPTTPEALLADDEDDTDGGDEIDLMSDDVDDVEAPAEADPALPEDEMIIEIEG